jgi:hypothetical protein
MNRTGFCVSLLALSPCFIAGCSGFGTSIDKMGRLRQNHGYEVAAELPVVQQAAIDVLKARGYDVQVKADPGDGAEGAGQIVIGQKTQHYSAAPSGATEGVTGTQAMDTRSLVDIYVFKKWQLGSDLGAPNITLVDIVGGNYLRKEPADEVETPLKKEFISMLRDEIERAVDASRLIPPPVKAPGA